ncbi:hypothetical protein DFH27DRAFT_525982 [Peziza echinospora]|nr:hypothetical protein DFH27DRAFT_525982 [Peziza echinospora]
MHLRTSILRLAESRAFDAVWEVACRATLALDSKRSATSRITRTSVRGRGQYLPPTRNEPSPRSGPLLPAQCQNQYCPYPLRNIHPSLLLLFPQASPAPFIPIALLHLFAAPPKVTNETTITPTRPASPHHQHHTPAAAAFIFGITRLARAHPTQAQAQRDPESCDALLCSAALPASRPQGQIDISHPRLVQPEAQPDAAP